MDQSAPRWSLGRAAGASLSPVDLLAPRWPGHPGHLDVWYLTMTDPLQRIGAWVHHEVAVAPTGAAELRGWTAVFRRDERPVLERFGPIDASAGDGSPSLDQAVFAGGRVEGRAGRLAWTFELPAPAPAPVDGPAAPLCTFPAWAWTRQLLPGAHVLPVPTAPIRGAVQVDGATLILSPASTGSVARIFGHGSPERWGWLHADLGAGDVLEVVTAVSRQPGLNHLPPLAFVQLRHQGRDWPRDPLLAAPRFRTRLGLLTWSVHGTSGRGRLRVDIRIPPEQAVTVGYQDPDGATATCTNSELADADIVLERRRQRWETVAHWRLEGTAHAEIGVRP